MTEGEIFASSVPGLSLVDRLCGIITEQAYRAFIPQGVWSNRSSGG